MYDEAKTRPLYGADVTIVRKITAAISGSLILAIGINLFLEPYELLDGGIIGIALISYYLWHIQAGMTIIVCSIPIFILAWFRYRPYFYNSLHGMVLSAVVIELVHPLQFYFMDIVTLPPLVSSIIGGTLVGIGIGTMLRYGISTGGTDLLAQLFSNISSINVGVLIFIIDALVVGLGSMILSGKTAVLSFITILAVGFSTTLCTTKRI